MSWFSNLGHHLGIRFDSHTLGNVLKNVSPALAFTPAGMLGSGGLAALGEALRGHANLGDMTKAGISNAAIGGTARGAMGLLHGAFVPSSSAATGAVPSAPAGVDSSTGFMGIGGGGQGGIAGMPGGSFADLGGPASGSLPSVSGAVPSISGDIANSTSSALRGLAANSGGGQSFLGRVGSFAMEHPNAIAGGLQGLGQIGSLNSENAMNRARAAQIQADTAMTQDDLARRKRLDDALGPIRQLLSSQFADMQTHPYPIAPNPYAHG